MGEDPLVREARKEKESAEVVGRIIGLLRLQRFEIKALVQQLPLAKQQEWLSALKRICAQRGIDPSTGLPNTKAKGKP